MSEIKTAPAEVVDLLSEDSPDPHSPVARMPPAAAAPPVPLCSAPSLAFVPPAAAAMDPPGIVNLLGDDDNEYYQSASRKRRRRGHWNGDNTSHRPKHFQGKSDPNEDAVVVVGKSDPNGEAAKDDIELVGCKAPPPEFEVLEIFPDADLNHIKGLLQKYNSDIAMAVADMAENTYPRSEKPALVSMTTCGLTLVRMEKPEAKWKYDYSSMESFKPAPVYIAEAGSQLRQDFPFLTKIGSQRILAHFKHHYAVCHDKILTAVKGTNFRAGETLEDAQYRRLLIAFAGHPLDKEQVERMDGLVNYPKTTMKKPRRKTGAEPAITDATLKEEIQYAKKKLEDWLQMARGKTNRKLNKEKALAAHTAVDCSCCFDEFAIQDMVSCRDEGHLFCVDCLKAYAENSVFGAGNLGIDKETKQPALELKCFHSDGCCSGFNRSALEKALPEKSLQKYDEIQFQVSLEAAGINDMCSCPKCGFQAALPPTQKVFQCPVIDCRYESCRECGEEAHIPLRCDEVEKERETKGRLTVEEAITQAKIRKCPKCGKGFIKSDGCNKIRCGCGTFVCYICRQAIKNYSHFCQAPHCTHKDCNKCALWTKAEEDDLPAMREAGLEAAAKVHADSLKETEASKKGPQELNIDVDTILQQPANQQ